MKLLIFDGNSIINRAFYAIKMLTNSKGQHTNAVYGFLNIYFKFLEEQKPDYVCVAFDLPGPTFRHEMYQDYKAKRKGMPSELAQQMPVLKDVLSAMNVSYITCEGYEADDIIGTVAKKCDELGVACNIVTGDKDDLQLVTDHTNVLLVSTKMGQTLTQCYDQQEIQDKYSLNASQLLDLKALMGDTSDNIPGIAGIGEKTALGLLQKYHSLDEIYENLASLPEKPALLKKLESGKEMAYLSRELGQINCDVPIAFDIEQNRLREYSNDKLYELLNELEFKSLLNKLGLSETQSQLDVPDVIPLNADNAASVIKELQNKDNFLYILQEKDIFFLSNQNIYQCPVEDIQWFGDVFGNQQIGKVTYDIKKDIVRLHGMGISLSYPGFDFLLAAYVCDPALAQGGFSNIVKRFIDENSLVFDEINQTKEGAAAALYIMDRLRQAMDEQLKKNNQVYLYYDVELYLTRILADMEIEGVYIDQEELRTIGDELDRGIAGLESEIYTLAQEQFNISSPKQLGVILFEKLGLPVVKKTKTGYSTDVDVLEKLATYHPIIDKIIQYRHMTKLKSTYIEGLLAVTDEHSRIHTCFNQSVTMTGRLSSTEPNLQNIPIRLELGRQIRRVFKCQSSDCVFVTADYSQIELRVLAHIADDKNMISAFSNNEDIHTATAAQVFFVPPEMVTPLMRSRAKAVNFGIVYGISDFSLSKNIGVRPKEAKEYIENYFKTYYGVRQYMDRIIQSAKETGYVETLFHRIRFIPELKSSNHNIRLFGERVALNTPIQGTAADIIKIAMVNIYKRFQEEQLKSKLILQVHDELIVMACVDELDKVETILKEQMEGVCQLKVPLTISQSKGTSWFDTKE